MSDSSQALLTADDAPPPAYAATYELAEKIVRSGIQGGSDWMPLLFMALVLAAPDSEGFKPLFSIVLIMVTLVLRDLCRWAGIHLLEYPDKRLLFLPFLRKRVPAEGDRAEAWKHGLIILLGPLPALILAFVVAVVSRGLPLPTLNKALLHYTILNGFWLLPFGSFDGSRLLNVVLFSRSRIVELIFLLAASIGFIGIGVWIGQGTNSIFFVIFGVLGLIRLPQRFRIRGAASQIAARFPGLHRRVEEIEDAPMRALFEAAHGLVTGIARRGTEQGQSRFAHIYAAMMRAVHAEAALIPPSLPMSILLLFLYGFGIVLAALTVLIAVGFRF